MVLRHIAWKIDYYMKKFILPNFNPEKIHWYFLLSGGKDSFVLADSIYKWYEKNNKHITATGLHIMQWEDSKKQIESLFSWLDDLLFLDARTKTQKILKSNGSKQMSCSECSGIRKACSDTFFNKMNNCSNMTNILCRGIHLTDIANSLLWRLLWERNPINSILDKGKGKPLVKLFSNLYLAKPLCFIREFESQNYANVYHYKPYQCNCPALIYPCRRDIVEESVSYFYTDLLWEFNVPGMDLFFSNVLQSDKILIQAHSLPGKEVKQPILQKEFFKFCVEYFYDITMKNKDILFLNVYDQNVHMEDYIPDLFLYSQTKCMRVLNFNFKLLTMPDKLTQFDERMISTLGPLWGAFSLNDTAREKAFYLQEKIYKLRLDPAWGQVTDLLELYYGFHRHI